MTDKIKWPGGHDTANFKRQAQKLLPKLQNGTMLAIDPASNIMGWALYTNMQLQDYGSFRTRPSTAKVNNKLGQIYEFVWAFDNIDVLCIELLKGSKIHRTLQNACGAVKAAQPDAEMIECPIPAWKACTKLWPNYTKTDENDAVMLSITTIAAAKGF